MNSNNAKSQLLSKVKNYVTGIAKDVNASYPRFKWYMLSLALLFIAWIACMLSGNEPVVTFALWFSVVFVIAMIVLLGLNISVDFFELVQVWPWLVGDNLLQKCATIISASTDEPSSKKFLNRKVVFALLLFSGILVGFLARSFFLYAMCIILNDGLFGDPLWYWLSIVIFEMIAIPSVFIHFALPIIDNELQML